MVNDLTKLRDDLGERGIDVLRVMFSDVLGIARSKDILVSQLDKACHNGPAFSQGVWTTTTGGEFHEANGIANDGLQDFFTQIVPSTISPLAWEPGVAYVVGDAFNPDGKPNMMSPRSVLQKVIASYHALGLHPVVGPELEFYIANQDEEGNFTRSLSQTGRVYMTGTLVDPDGDFLHLMRMLDNLNIGAFAGNHEFSPAQYEVNLWHSEALDAADRTFFFKTAVKDIIAKRGKHASFLGKPWSDEGGSGFHLHFSVTDSDGINKMHDGRGNLSPAAKMLIAGITKHANALTAFTNPTVNAFKRLGPDTLAPYRSNWGYDNRSCMVRVPPERGQGTRLEIRVGDGAANPYLVIAAILAAGLDGIVNELECPPDAVGMAYDNEGAEILPETFSEALDALEKDDALRTQMSQELINVFMVLKRDEIARYEASVDDPNTREVTEWEITEYAASY
ncbi:glutamine synthetase [Aurantimicrobium minutum]|uniref:glutamine synthetase family protein n=1 Tax=Aurantimicrobium minutum TaxID=708131 RepID=UPI002473CB54|nr:glutamine synthetase family protein [Aurantimicrobium minutum]MDH6409898.1 glutamine synthetase [Aurantimicrobium minutum]